MDAPPTRSALTVCARLLRAAGLALWTLTVPVAFLVFRDRYQDPVTEGRPWPWERLWLPALGALLALTAPWIARRFRWRDEAPASTPAPVSLRPAWLLALVAAAGAILFALWIMTDAFAVTLAHDLRWDMFAIGAAVSLGVVGFGLARATSADVPDRASLLLAVLRAGGLFGLACAVAGVGSSFGGLLAVFASGPGIDEVLLPHFLEVAVAPVVWLLWVACVEFSGRRRRDDAAPARPRHVLAAVAATMAVALVAPTVALVEGWRWRTVLYDAARVESAAELATREARAAPAAEEARSASRAAGASEAPAGPCGELIPDGRPDPDGFARRAWTLTAGFAGFVLVAAVAGRRGRGDARPG